MSNPVKGCCCGGKNPNNDQICLAKVQTLLAVSLATLLIIYKSTTYYTKGLITIALATVAKIFFDDEISLFTNIINQTIQGTVEKTSEIFSTSFSYLWAEEKLDNEHEDNYFDHSNQTLGVNNTECSNITGKEGILDYNN